MSLIWTAQAIGSLFVRAPELMLKPHVQAIIKKGLASESYEVRLQMLLNISEFLAAEEAKALSATAGKQQKKSAKPGTTPEPTQPTFCTGLNSASNCSKSEKTSEAQGRGRVGPGRYGRSQRIAGRQQPRAVRRNGQQRLRVRSRVIVPLFSYEHVI
jgi:hypothetical protein